MTIDTLKVAKAMEDAGMPRSQSEALAKALRDEVMSDLVTNDDLGAAVDRLEGKVEAEVNRLEGKVEAQVNWLEGKIEAQGAGLRAEIAEVRAEIRALDAKGDRIAELMREQMAHMQTRIERLIMSGTLALLLAMFTVVGLLVRFWR